MIGETYDQAVQKCRHVLSQLPSRPVMEQIIHDRDKVLSRYQPVFAMDNLPRMSADTFISFLHFENNCHWSGLHRHSSALTADMGRLRRALTVLLDDSVRIDVRYDRSVRQVRGLGKAVATSILLIAKPMEYGVWNNTSEAALTGLGIWPAFMRGSTVGEKYAKVNSLLKRLARDLGVDLWTLDALIWGTLPLSDEPKIIERLDADLEDRAGWRRQ